MSKPLLAMRESPRSNFCNSPLQSTRSRSEMEPSYSGDTTVNAPSGDIPTNDLQVFAFLYAEKVALCDGSDDGR